MSNEAKDFLTRQNALSRQMREDIVAEFKDYIKLPEATLFLEGVLLHSFFFDLIRLRMEREKGEGNK